MPKKVTTKEFIKRSKVIHGNKYDYSKSEYKGAHEQITVVCKKHGEFKQRASDHSNGRGCKECSREKTSERFLDTKQSFVRKAIRIHGNKYDYSLVEYKKSNIKVKIVCPVHGEFEQKPSNHLCGCGCYLCGNETGGVKRAKNLDSFVEEANTVHNNKFDYSKVVYTNATTKVIITCPVHGDFKQVASSHLLGIGCPKCGGTGKSDTKDFIAKAKLVHGKKYDYSKVDYKNSSSKVAIVCSVHGAFLQTPGSHLQGIGCPRCCDSKGEIKIRNFLIENKFAYDREYKFKDCRNKRPLPFDFAIFKDKEKTKLKCLIEFDGKQHFEEVKRFGGQEGFIKIKKTDKIKNDYCLKNNIKLVRIPYWDIENIEEKLNKVIYTEFDV